MTEPVLPPHYVKTINSHWTFNYFPDATEGSGYESPLYDDSNWPAISIPHTWNSYETTFELHSSAEGNTGGTDNPRWREGRGWYRKHFIINPAAAGKKIFIEFDGVQKYCKLWLNGKYLGDHDGFHTSFVFDITEHTVTGKDNVLAVAVSNSGRNQAAGSAAEENRFHMFGGIYRDVRLIITDRLYITLKEAASPEKGIITGTPAISERDGVVSIRASVRNDYPDTRKCIVKTCITDRSGRNVQVLKSRVSIAPGRLYGFEQLSRPIAGPQLWSPGSPALYGVRTEVTSGGKVTDVYNSTLAFKRFEWNSDDRSLLLNDEKIVLRGGRLNPVHPWLGIAIPRWMREAEIRNMAENLGYNYLVTGIVPADRFLYELADRYGIIIIDEEFSTAQAAVETMAGSRDAVADSKEAGTGNKDTGAGNKDTGAGSKDTAADNKETGTGTRGAVSAGEPVKIVVKGSHLRTEADKGSVVVIFADIADREGNPVKKTDRVFTWNVSGPATLAGCPVYVPDDGSNIIRSDGNAGIITVTVSSPGLASGSVTIEALAGQPDNTVVDEPVLSDVGRKRVFVPEQASVFSSESGLELDIIYKDIDLGRKKLSEYRREIGRIISENNPPADSASIEYRTLVSLLAAHLEKNGGILSAYDYNYNIGHYNNCRVITGYVNPLKLPQLYKDWLKRYYAEEMITKGYRKNAIDEMNWLNWIPSGGTVAVRQKAGHHLWPKGTVITATGDLAEMIAAVHPVFRKYSREAKERALVFIAKMNPYLNKGEGGSQQDSSKAGNFKYTAGESVPVLIPFLKFISE
jgi:hypothetical protein